MKTIDTRQKERARRLSQLLKASSLKQIEIAEALGVPPSSVSKWGLGQTVPTGARLEALASLLGVSADYIRTGKDDGAALASDCLYIPVLPLNGGPLFGVVDALRLNADALRSLGLKPESLALFLIDSDAMAPAIPLNALALVDTAAADTAALIEGLYLIKTADGIRRAVRLVYSAAGSAFISDSPAYRREPVPVESVQILGRIRLILGIALV